MPAKWHPVQTLQPIQFHFPRPGTPETFAIIRWVDVELQGVPMSRWRAVTYAQPRRLIGYFALLEDAAAACHRAHTLTVGTNVVHSHTGPARVSGE